MNVTNQLGTAIVRRRIADIYAKKGYNDRVLNIYLDVLHILKVNKIYDETALCHKNLARLYKRKGEIENYYKHINEALSIYKAIGNVSATAHALLEMALYHRVGGNYTKAIAQIKKAKEIFEKLKDTHGLTLSYNSLGNNYNLMNDKVMAQKYFEEALTLANQNGFLDLKASTQVNMGSLISSENPDEAIRLYESSLSIFEKLKIVDEEGKVLGNIGSLFIAQVKVDRALEYLERALEKFKITENVFDQGIVLANIGEAYFIKHMPEHALSFYKKSIKCFEQSTKSPHYANILLKIGTIYMNKYELEKAITSFQNALDATNKYDKTLTGDIYLCMGISYARQDKDDMALSLLDKAKNIYKKHNNKNKILQTEEIANLIRNKKQ